MDGSRTVGELVVERMGAGGGLDAEPVTDLVIALYVGGFLDPAPIPTDELIADRLDPSSPSRKKLKKFGKTLSIDWKGADRLVRFCYRNLLRPFFRWPVAMVSGLLALAGLAAFAEVATSGQFSLGEGPAPTEAAVLLALAFFLTFMHELGHSVVISHYGRKVKSAGFKIYFGSPAFFVDATDSLMLERRQRILQAFAGPFTELVIAGVAAIAIFTVPRRSARGPALQVRAPQLHRDLPQPGPDAGARRLLDPLRSDPGPRPPTPLSPIHPARSVAQDPGPRAAHAAGVGTRRVRRSPGSRSRSSPFWVGFCFWQEIFWELVLALGGEPRLEGPPRAPGQRSSRDRSSAACSDLAQASSGASAAWSEPSGSASRPRGVSRRRN